MGRVSPEEINAEEAELRKEIKVAGAELDQLAYEKYPQLSVKEIQTLVVDEVAVLAAKVDRHLQKMERAHAETRRARRRGYECNGWER